MKVGIIGAGSIGNAVARAVQGELSTALQLVAVCDVDQAKAGALVKTFAPRAQVVGLSELLFTVDIAVESAAAEVVPEVIKSALSTHKAKGNPQHLLIMSVGGLLGLEIPDNGPSIHIPSGAIGGLDAIKAMREDGLEEVVLTTRKPPASLGLDLDEEQVLFDGIAAEVVRRYPKNINVAMALSLAGIGPDKTRVRLIADPKVKRNSHHIYAKGKAGEVEFTSRNLPFPDNPRTSYLAALSAIAVLRTIVSTLKFG